MVDKILCFILGHEFESLNYDIIVFLSESEQCKITENFAKVTVKKCKRCGSRG